MRIVNIPERVIPAISGLEQDIIAVHINVLGREMNVTLATGADASDGSWDVDPNAPTVSRRLVPADLPGPVIAKIRDFLDDLLVIIGNKEVAAGITPLDPEPEGG